MTTPQTPSSILGAHHHTAYEIVISILMIVVLVQAILLFQRPTTKTSTITIVSPIKADFTATSPSTSIADFNLLFQATVSGGLGPYAYIWDFGDGLTSGTILSSSSNTTVHPYLAGGSYTASLKVFDHLGQTAVVVHSFSLYPLTVILSGRVVASGITAAPNSIQFTGNGQTYSAMIESPHFYMIVLPNGHDYNYTVYWNTATLSSSIHLLIPYSLYTLNLTYP